MNRTSGVPAQHIVSLEEDVVADAARCPAAPVQGLSGNDELRLFFEPQRLGEQRRAFPELRRISGVLLAGLVGVALLVGEAGASNDQTAPPSSAETGDGVDFWEWLTGGPDDTPDDTRQDDDGGGSGDPGSGEPEE
jgi:hypothetical protein